MKDTNIREPAVAGRFYPARRVELDATVREYLRRNKSPRNFLAIFMPHAGYVYSGSVAGAVAASANVPDTAVLIGPNHTGLGARAAVWTSGAWRTPLGDVPVDEELARELVTGSAILRPDVMAHVREHALEVQLPFLLERNPRLKIVPITLGGLSLQELRAAGADIARSIARAREATGRQILIVVSSDMNHYLPDALTRQLDRLAIDAMLELDPEKLFWTVEEKDLSVCGYQPITAMLEAVRRLGATRAELLDYATSGDVSGDLTAVVGYAGLGFE